MVKLKEQHMKYWLVDLGNNAEGILPKKDLIARERFRVGDKIRACVESC